MGNTVSQFALSSKGFQTGGRHAPDPGQGQAALALAGIARQLDAVNREHLAANQSLVVAHAQHLGKQLGGLVTQTANELGTIVVKWAHSRLTGE